MYYVSRVLLVLTLLVLMWFAWSKIENELDRISEDRGSRYYEIN